ncbi:IS30B/C/D transposase [Legionella quinlivanii]|uniref:IS30B/C/D transposase n=2 Tax=Legionella quinlivanii TaxID=45073 RepID=A0A0W0XTB9_9GAMM|nr:IS30 family transposase [Legionella quinlivanii]KTD47491.1 IS30B/C/D transposase [Legionella quinlivanii]STY09980.1 IS30B/C/D transposase [Legionella quinlivanii]STY09994.1 IS30B/C/D transposase [Legionella quinlivanii]STY10012.1 IS30B/C/D transposase [Legionella quinlivanii]STY49777.1 IS30B/C/D transposase [Legionella quinlivanii]
MVRALSKRSFTEHQQDVIWSLWSQGKSLSEIGRQLNKHAGSIFCFLQKSGGIKPVKSIRSKQALTLYEREEISRGLSANLSIRTIAKTLNRSPSTISREINRNGGISKYRAILADKQTWIRAKRPKQSKLQINILLNDIIADKLSNKWSPEQISGYLKRTYPNNTAMNISHESIYKTLYVQSRGHLKKELLTHLRTQRVMRQSKKFNTKGNARGGIIDAVSIHDRPKEIDSRTVPGHWEGDLICGSNKSYVATLVERTSRFTLLVKLTGNDTASVVHAITNKIIELPNQLKKSLTWDRGMELAKHKKFTIDTEIKVYFCDPKSPWQRGTNENTNRLLRQYMPKKTDLGIHSQFDLDRIAKELNERPRKTLNFLSPADKLNEVLQ